MLRGLQHQEIPKDRGEINSNLIRLISGTHEIAVANGQRRDVDFPCEAVRTIYPISGLQEIGNLEG